MPNHLYYIGDGFDTPLERYLLATETSGIFIRKKVFGTQEIVFSKYNDLQNWGKNYLYIGNLREFILDNDIKPYKYKFTKENNIYKEANENNKEYIINNYGIDMWNYLQDNDLLIPIFSYEEIENKLFKIQEEITNTSISENSVAETGVNEENNIEILPNDMIKEDTIEEYKILEQEVENNFYEKDSIKISIKVNDDYQDIYSNYLLYSCEDNLTISDQENLNIVEEDFRTNGIDGEVQLLGSLKSYIIENEIELIGYRYEELSDEDNQYILETYGKEAYNYYKEKGYPIICFDSKELHDIYIIRSLTSFYFVKLKR